jgi:prepilin-type N-terminal cleavage/methylation domain-containing protein
MSIILGKRGEETAIAPPFSNLFRRKTVPGRTCAPTSVREPCGRCATSDGNPLKDSVRGCRYCGSRRALRACRRGGMLRGPVVRSDPMQDKGFSLIELVIVAVIVAVLAAIALPRLSRGSRGASDAALDTDLAALQKPSTCLPRSTMANSPVPTALPSSSRSARTAEETPKPRRTPSTSMVLTCVPFRLCRLAPGRETPG